MKQEMIGSQQYQLNHTQIRENLIVQVFKDQMLFLKPILNQRSRRQITYLDVFKHFAFPNSLFSIFTNITMVFTNIAILRPLYRTTCITWHPQLKTEGFC